LCVGLFNDQTSAAALTTTTQIIVDARADTTSSVVKGGVHASLSGNADFFAAL
jgi:hypothetical protein